jgi:hypothetical protein
MRRIAAAGVVAALLVLPASASATADDPGLVYACSPPQAPTAASCAAWHTSAVELIWDWDRINWEPATDVQNIRCDDQTIDADTAGTRIRCAVWKRVDQTPIKDAIVTIRIDKTPPVVTGFTPDRAPDHDGWWNHPVSLQFNGTDATSGIAGCDLVGYGGPDGDKSPVMGECRDVAGNAATATFPIKYDATPPSVAALPADTDVGRNAVNWTTSSDAVATQVLRSPGVGAAAVSEVYSGSGHTFSDSVVTGGKTYRYTLNASDAAGNVASTTIDITAKPAPQPPPAASASKDGPPRLTWRRIRGADYYNVQLYRKGAKILSAWPHRNALKLRASWTFRGRQRALTAGSYDWYVWAGFGKRSRHHYGKLIVHRRFTMPATNAAAPR